MLSSTSFASGLGLDIHIRTTRVDSVYQSYSYISGVAMRSGSNVLEVTDDGSVYINGNDNFEQGDVSAFTWTKKMKGSKKNIIVYDFNVNNGDARTRAFNVQVRANGKSGMLFVDLPRNASDTLSDGVGLLGTIDVNSTSRLMARDGVTDLVNEWNSFAEEWQVLSSEPKLFQESRAPQHPTGCFYDVNLNKSKNLRRRRLMDASSRNDVSHALAKEVCSHASGQKKSFCVFDIMATGDLDLAEDPFYQ